MEPHSRTEAQPQCGAVPRRVALLCYPFRWRIAKALGLTAVACLLNLTLPLLVERCVDGAVAGAEGRMVAGYAVAMLCVYFAQAAAALAATVAAGAVGLAVVRDLRRLLYAHLQRLPLRYFDETPAGAILARVTDDVAAVQAIVGGPVLAAATDLATAAAVALLLAWQSPTLALVAATFIPAYVLTARWFGPRVRRGSTAVREQLDTVFGHLKEKLDGVTVVRVSAREPAEVQEFARRLAAAHLPRLRVARLAAAFGQMNLTLGGIGAAAVFAAAAWEVAAGRLTVGGAVASATLSGLLFGPLSRAADLVTVLAQAGAGLRRVFAVIEQPACPATLPLAGKMSVPLDGAIEFDDVSFSYGPGRPAVEAVSLAIRPGATVALVGPTGCGKSTLLSLLLRFYEPIGGRIRVGGRPLAEVDPFELRRRIGMVPQDVCVFRGSVAENIRWAAPDADPGRVLAAARAAGLDEFINILPDGLDTIIGEGGYRLSHGQRQRLGIARILCKDADLVLLDEPTGSLDPEAEADVQAALDRLLEGRTAIVVAHRLATVTDADLIVVMDAGRIVDAGTHGDLLAGRGLYRRLWESQFGQPTETAIPTLQPEPWEVPERVAA
jgi:ABC-type multidrug transport system fused ATPase/permease subunit